MKVVIDTNTMISGLLWKGPPHELIVLGEEKKITWCSSIDMLDELEGVLGREKFRSRLEYLDLTVNQVMMKVKLLSEIYTSIQRVKGVNDDPDDDIFLACAKAAGVRYLISGDTHLLKLKAFENTRIMPAHEFLNQVLKKGNP